MDGTGAGMMNWNQLKIPKFTTTATSQSLCQWWWQSINELEATPLPLHRMITTAAAVVVRKIDGCHCTTTGAIMMAMVVSKDNMVRTI